LLIEGEKKFKPDVPMACFKDRHAGVLPKRQIHGIKTFMVICYRIFTTLAIVFHCTDI
jgi:hypothetical protein